MTIEQQCEAARARLLIFVNRMAAQLLGYSVTELLQEQEMTQAQLYSILMESDTAYKNAEWICAALGVPCPPDRTDDSEIELHEEVDA